MCPIVEWAISGKIKVHSDLIEILCMSDTLLSIQLLDMCQNKQILRLYLLLIMVKQCRICGLLKFIISGSKER